MSEATAMDSNLSEQEQAIEKVRQVLEYFGRVPAPEDLVHPDSQTAWRLEQLLGFLEDQEENGHCDDGVKCTDVKVTVTILESEKMCFGRLMKTTVVPNNVKLVYSIIHKLTGKMGGNGSHGPIYGELTVGSMQKIVNTIINLGFCILDIEACYCTLCENFNAVLQLFKSLGCFIFFDHQC